MRVKPINYRLYNNIIFVAYRCNVHDELYPQDMSRPPNTPSKQKNKNNINTQSTHLNATNDLEDVIENMDDDSINWTKVQSSKDGKRYHSSSSEQNSPRTPVNKNKKFFFSANRFEVLSQNDHETMLPTTDTTNTNIKKPVASLNVEPEIALPPTNILKTTTCYFH